MSGSSKKTTVVIPNWNGMKYLKACLDSLMVQDTDDFEILLIDNASTDESVSFIEENYDINVRVMPENLGFSGGVNEGIRLSETPYVILLNNDTECDRHFVKGLVDAIESDDRIFSVGARMVNYHDRSLLDDAGDLYTIMGWQIQRGVGQKVTDPRYDKMKRVFSACAGAAIYRKKVFDEIGYFDVDHFMYLEDIDVGYRSNIFGYKNMYTKDAVVYHVGSAATGAVKYNDFKVTISARNSVWLAYKNQPLIQRGINFFPMWLGRKLKQRFFRKEGFGEAYIKGVKEGFETRKDRNKVSFQWKHIGHYMMIEWMLFKNIFIYVDEYLRRHK